MNKDAIIKLVNEQMWPKTDADVPSFKAGDTITVSYKIVEGNKERVQSFRGVVIQIKGSGKTKMFTIRKISNGVGVERIFPLYSPHIDKIEVNKIGVVRRARIYYLRDLTGKKARIKEEIIPRSERENRMSEKASCFFASERSAEPTGDVRERCRRSFQRIVFSLEPGQSRLVAAFDQTVQGCDLLRSESQAGDDFGRQPGWFCKGQNENSKRDKRDETIVK